ncbi:MAG: M15 family metallopeptidase [Methylovulum sp.]|nr:M15 family metallopeptidase [Methylovulum sp.]
MHIIPFGLLFSAALVFTGTGNANPPLIPQDFTYVDETVPNIKLAMSYCTEQNFIGKPIDGYLKPRAILTRAATDALSAVQNELAAFGLGLKIFDAYRPQRAVDHFVRWAADADDTVMKNTHYPHIDKAKLIGEGYILSHSGHSRGSTVDLTLVSLSNGEDLDMGGIFDFFGPESWTTAATPTPSQRAHRMLLQVLMEQHGFVYYPKEWWHFTLKNEPYPDTYFDFPVQ